MPIRMAHGVGGGQGAMRTMNGGDCVAVCSIVMRAILAEIGERHAKQWGSGAMM